MRGLLHLLAKLATMGPKRTAAWKGAPAPSLLEQQEQKEIEDQSQAKRSRKRSLEETVHKALRDNFKGFSDVQTDLTIKEGRSLRQRIIEDKRAQLEDPKIKTGKFYYDELRTLYGSDKAPEQMLQVYDETETVDKTLMDACTAALSHKKNFAPLTEFALAVTTMNQKSTVGLFRTILKVSPAISMQNTSLLTDIMTMIVRLDMQNKFPREFGIIRSHLDSALCKSLGSFKQHGQSARLWWEASKVFASLLLPSEDTQKCIECDSAWTDVSVQLARVVQSSDIGTKMFSSAWRDLQARRLRFAIDQVINKLDGVDLDKAAVLTAREAFKIEVAKLGKNANETYTRREVLVSYRGQEIPVVVTSLMDEYTLAEQAFLRSRGVQLGVLPELWCESALVATCEPKPQKMTADLVQESARARQAAMGFLNEGEEITSEAIKEVLVKRGGVLLQLDRFFKVEVAFFMAFMGEKAATKFEQDILQCLPWVGADFRAEESLVKLDILSRGSLIAFCGVGMQAVFNSVRAFVYDISQCRPPKFDSTSVSPFLKQVQSRLARFLAQSVSDSKSKATATLYGVEAVVHLFATVKANHGTDTQVTYLQLQPLHVFGWLLEEPDRQTVLAWTNAAVASCALVAPSSASSSSSKKSGSKAKGTETKAMVSALFV